MYPEVRRLSPEHEATLRGAHAGSDHDEVALMEELGRLLADVRAFARRGRKVRSGCSWCHISGWGQMHKVDVWADRRGDVCREGLDIVNWGCGVMTRPEAVQQVVLTKRHGWRR